MKSWLLILSLLLLGGCAMMPLAWPPQDTTVLPCLYRDARPDEQFFISREAPRIVEEDVVLDREDGEFPLDPARSSFYKKRVWEPYHFTTWFWSWGPSYIPPGKGERAWGLQFYRGQAKVDGSRTRQLHSGSLCGVPLEGWVYTTTKKEMRALRFRDIGIYPDPYDQGGS